MIARAAYANSTIRSIVSMPNYVFRYSDGRTRELENTNKVLKRLPYCNGMKTGYTDAAGSCLISSASRPGRDVIVVVLGHTKPRIWQDSAAFLTWALWHGARRSPAPSSMSDLFHEQLQALRAQSLHRKLREIGTAQGPEVQIVGQQLA